MITFIMIVGIFILVMEGGEEAPQGTDAR